MTIERSSQQRTWVASAKAGLVVAVIAIAGLFSSSAAYAAPIDEIPEPPEGVEVLEAKGQKIYFMANVGFFYGSFDSPYTVIVGGMIENVCEGHHTSPIMRVVTQQNKDGSWTRQLPHPAKLDISVYENPTDNFLDTFRLVCTGQVPMLDPVMTGWGHLDFESTTAHPYGSGAQDTGHHKNSFKGHAWDADGVEYKIDAAVDFVADGSGPPPFEDFYLSVRPNED